MLSRASGDRVCKALAYPSLKPHIVFIVLDYWSSDPIQLIINHEGQELLIVDHFEFNRVEIFQGISLPETAHFVF